MRPVTTCLVTTKFFVLLVLLAVSLPGSGGIRITDMQVPPRVQAGDTVSLACKYDLEGQELYSLNWWRGTEQFYMYSPATDPPKTVYDTAGINVDVRKSGHNEVVLTNVSHTSAGRYKCEVLTEYPRFEKDSQSTHMEVVDVPTKDPKISVPRAQWSEGEVLKANCTSQGTRPPPELHWYINGEKISAQHSRLIKYEANRLDAISHDMIGMGMDTSRGRTTPLTSELSLVLRASHFTDGGHANLACAATLHNIYHRTTTEQLFLPGFKRVGSSEKLYDSAEQVMGAALLVLVDLILVALLTL